MLRDQQTNGVDRITNATKGQRQANSHAIDKSTGEETHDGECTVQGDVLLILVYVEKKFSLERGARQKKKSHTMLSAKCASVFPPPPNPLSALNMPGHRKHTKATMPN